MMITTRMTTAALTLAAVAVALTGCSGGTADEPASASPTPAAAMESSAAEAPAEPTNPIPTSCPEFLMTAAHMATDWQYLNLNLGTTNDEGPTLADLAAGSAAMQDLASTCAPAAVEEVDAFAATVAPVQEVYTTQPTGDQVQAVDDALATMQAAGAEMFTALEMATYAWED